jgi:hypothetical protein
MAVDRQTVDLSAYPDLVGIFLGMRVRRPRGMLALLGLGLPAVSGPWQPEWHLSHSVPLFSCASTTSLATPAPSPQPVRSWLQRLREAAPNGASWPAVLTGAVAA